MHPIIDKFNALAGTAIALLTAIFGTYWYVFVAYLVCTVLAYVTGLIKARILHKESSSVGLKGILKKLGYWIIIALAFLVSEVFVHMGADLWQMDFSFMAFMGWFTLGSLLINEIRSILENLVEAGLKVPNIFIRGLDIAGKMMDKDKN